VGIAPQTMFVAFEAPSRRLVVLVGGLVTSISLISGSSLLRSSAAATDRVDLILREVLYLTEDSLIEVMKLFP
jgi:hypothetical protein